MKTFRLNFCLIGPLILAACAEEPPPPSVDKFLKNPRMLEAAMIRCGLNRSETKYLAECVNAREAINRMEVGEKQAKRAELEAQSERKRQALRRTQAAVAAATPAAYTGGLRRGAATTFCGQIPEKSPDAGGGHDSLWTEPLRDQIPGGVRKRP